MHLKFQHNRTIFDTAGNQYRLVAGAGFEPTTFGL
ncbi:hypothetical protein GBM02_02440 [Yersinia pseudotuberculosis]|nr:hypothetical protein [Yersinia pseudotuberculosis]